MPEHGLFMVGVLVMVIFVGLILKRSKEVIVREVSLAISLLIKV